MIGYECGKVLLRDLRWLCAVRTDRGITFETRLRCTG